jgi:heterodisulfide reductase subunit D
MATQPISLTDGLTRLQLLSLDACSRCNVCLDWCTVQDVLHDPSISPPEKIRIYGEMVRESQSLKAKLFSPAPLDHDALVKLSEAIYKCTTCGRCGEVCEVGIDTMRLWPALRKKMVELGVGPMDPQKATLPTVKATHNPYGKPHEDRFAWIPADVAVEDRAEVGYYAGCSGPYTAQPQNIGALKMMQAAGIRFTLNRDEWCCGFPLWVIGVWDILEELVKHNVEWYADHGVRRLVVSCPCCTDHITRRWPEVYGKALPFEVIHITQFMCENMDAVKFTKSLDVPITYHDPCYLSRGMGIVDEPRKIIEKFPGVNLVEMKQNREHSRCCGAGGGARRAYSPMTLQIGENYLREVEAIGAKTLVGACPACYERFHLIKSQPKFHTDVRVVDLMQLAAELL